MFCFVSLENNIFVAKKDKKIVQTKSFLVKVLFVILFFLNYFPLIGRFLLKDIGPTNYVITRDVKHVPTADIRVS